MSYLNIDGEEIELISQLKTIRKLEFIRNTYGRLQLESMFNERYVLQLVSNLPNLETFVIQRKYRIELILTHKNIHHIEKKLQKIIPSATLHIYKLKGRNNTFTDHYSTKTMVFPDGLDINEISLTIREVNKIFLI